jgi:hypothetical protein
VNQNDVTREQLDQIGADPLVNSGFEDEQPLPEADEGAKEREDAAR